jgi:uncharacterized RDD family membrane protein YckC
MSLLPTAPEIEPVLPPASASHPTPRLRRRLAAFVYEGVILFGVLMLAGYLYSALTQQRHALHGRHGLQAFLFLILGIYFIWFWSHGGQTVAMRAWHVRLIRQDGQPVGQIQALARYVLTWLWFVPALALAFMMDWHGSALYLALLTGVVLYAALVRMLPDGQFLHDRWCGTRLIVWDARVERDRSLAARRHA